ncbi:condensation domain-containing protein [Spirillospora sp. NPDC049652]
MLGLFINTVPVRVRLDPARSAAGMLADLQDARSRLLAHQHLGQTEIRRAAGPAAVFDTLLVYQNYPRGITAGAPADGPSGAGLRITGAEGEDASHYPLTLVGAAPYSLAGSAQAESSAPSSAARAAGCSGSADAASKYPVTTPSSGRAGGGTPAGHRRAGPSPRRARRRAGQRV